MLKKAKPYIIIAAATLIALSIFLNHGYPTGHDLAYHASSIIGMTNHSFWDIFTSKIFGFMSNDFGFGEGLFYPPFAHIIAAVIYKLIGSVASVFITLKIFYFLTMFFSGVFFRKLILLITKNEKAALFSSIFYITTPYFIADIVVRCAMAETTMFLFMPITLIGIYHLLHDNYKKFLIYFTIGCVGLIHSHLVLMMYFALLCCLGFAPKIKEFFHKKRLLYFGLSVFITALMSLPFLVPMLENKNNADYNVFRDGFMTSVNFIEKSRVPPDYLLTIDKVFEESPVPFYLSFFGIIALGYALFKYRKIKNDNNAPFLLFALIITPICLFCSTTLFPWNFVPHPLLYIQFSWRLLSFVSLGMAIIVGICLPKMEVEFGKIIYIILALSCLFSVAQINNYKSSDDIFQKDLATSANYIVDHAPVEITGQEIIETHTHDIISSDKNIDITNISSNTPDLAFKVSGVKSPVTITLPRYYYLGYDIKAVSKDQQIKHLDYYNQDGFIAFNLDTDAEITINYPGTHAQQTAYWVAGSTTLAFVAYCIFAKPSKKKN